MNLQISVPHQKCVYRCPMCVARSHKNENSFANLYATNPKEWRKRLESAVKNGNYDAIVITGECDPTQDMRYVNDVINVIWNIRGIVPNIEFTHLGNPQVTRMLGHHAHTSRPDAIHETLGKDGLA